MAFQHAKAAKQLVIRVRRRKILKRSHTDSISPSLSAEGAMLALLIIRARRPCASNNFLIQEIIELTHVRFCYIL